MRPTKRTTPTQRVIFSHLRPFGASVFVMFCSVIKSALDWVLRTPAPRSLLPLRRRFHLRANPAQKLECLIQPHSPLPCDLSGFKGRGLAGLWSALERTCSINWFSTAARTGKKDLEPGFSVRGRVGQSVRPQNGDFHLREALFPDTSHQSFRKFSRINRPLSVRMLSGWNCTPQTGKCLWRTPITSPSSVSAVISRHSGMLDRSMTRE